VPRYPEKLDLFVLEVVVQVHVSTEDVLHCTTVVRLLGQPFGCDYGSFEIGE